MADGRARILVLIPCYRCADQIGRVVARLDEAALPEVAHVLVIDNRSPDDTVARAREALAASRLPAWTILVNDRNVSLGGSHKVAFAYARAHGYSHVLVVHGDDQAAPANFRDPLAAGLHRTHDAVLGGRFMPGSRLTGYGRFRIFGNHVFNALFRLATRRPIQDLGSGLNIYGPRILAAEDERSACDDLTFHCDLLITLIARGRDLRYVPVDWREDDQVSNAKLVRQSSRILKILAAHAMGLAPPRGPGQNAPAESYTARIAAEGTSPVEERRTHCAVCGSAALRPTDVAFALPAYQGCVPRDVPASEQRVATLRFDTCAACGSGQVANPLPVALVYQGGHATGLGAAWDAHHARLAAFLQAHSHGAIVEYGGGAGNLARHVRRIETGPVRPWCIVEPNPVRSGPDIAGLTYREGFFGPDTPIPPETGTVLFCHCLEHLPDIAGSLRHLAAGLAPGRRVVIAWPDLEDWIDRGVPGAINWEHTIFCRFDTLVAAFQEAGFALVAREAYGPGHSLFAAFERRDGLAPVIPRGDADDTRRRLGAYAESFRTQARAVAAALDGRPYYLTPASIYAQALLAGGLPDNCLGLVDNAPIKQGRTLYGTGLRVHGPEILTPDDIVVINGGAHGDEIARGLAALRPGLRLLHADGRAAA
ncbi:methyltransferase domain-containing protein [Methylobacterium sp. J-090]|uniref:methyltransferase domain-containing protein n=1 Tax=Methylobacterium sp. J-090 TaxID=2836666 RepID=UPI001FB96702|nr:methyltransferase domain-containing protein [Methylobacterium sp. J-090]MCJ2081052.1 bifunctional glycosyltransferase/class I SAM-dependent methyltransferase [Methylobacterium sp. J-090]